MTEMAAEKGKGLVEQQRHWVAQELSNCQNATRAAAQRFHEEEDHQLGNLADMLADRFDTAKDYFQKSDMRKMRSDVAQLGRRHPGALFGVMFITGLAVARFLKASPESERFQGIGRGNLPEPYGDAYDTDEFDRSVPTRVVETPQAVRPDLAVDEPHPSLDPEITRPGSMPPGTGPGATEPGRTPSRIDEI
jgi:hypothetical protein